MFNKLKVYFIILDFFIWTWCSFTKEAYDQMLSHFINIILPYKKVIMFMVSFTKCPTLHKQPHAYRRGGCAFNIDLGQESS